MKHNYRLIVHIDNIKIENLHNFIYLILTANIIGINTVTKNVLLLL